MVRTVCKAVCIAGWTKSIIIHATPILHPPNTFELFKKYAKEPYFGRWLGWQLQYIQQKSLLLQQIHVSGCTLAKEELSEAGALL